MKKFISSIIACVLLCLFNFSAISQPYSTNIHGSITPSVSAMSYGKYADSPIDPATGTMGAAIPLYSLSDGTLSHSVSLSYHTGGIRVSELSSEVGLGWHLNTGGVIARTVRGLPDDHEDGYWNKAQNISTDSTGIGDIADGDIDGEPDLFFYNIGGMVGKFIIDENQNIHTIPKSDIKIEINHQGAPNLYQGFLGFKVTAPDGTLYYLGYYPGGGGHAPGGAGVTALQSLSIPGTDTHYDTWFLNRIESFDFKHKIDFEYANSFYRYEVNEECFITKYWLNGSQTGTDNCDGNQFFVTVFGRVLDKITTTTEEITFTHATRDDLEDHNNTNLPKRITKVNVNNGNYCFYYDLSQSYFTSNTGSGNLDKRLKLNSVQKKSCDNSINEEPFTFSYYGGSFFPSLTSKAIDHWGYYNGKTTNNSLDDLIPASSVVTPANNKTLYYGSADRETVESAMLNGALKRITFPTKGYTEYSYEANEYLETNNNNQQLFWAETCTSYGGYCCGNRSNTKYQVLDQAMIDNGVLELVVQHDGQNINCSTGYHSASITIYDQSNGGSYVYGFSNNIYWNGTATVTKNLSTISGLVAGHQYKFVLASVDARGQMELNYTPSGVTKLAGGLRVQEVKTHDGLSSLNGIKRTFEYEEAGTNEPSGVLTNKPSYAFNTNGYTAVFSSTGVLALTNFSGRHITYSRVVEYLNGNGYKEYLLNTENYTPNQVPDYPAKPGMYLTLSGTLKRSNVYQQNGTLEASTGIKPFEPDVYSYMAGHKIAAVRANILINSSTVSSNFLRSDYDERTGVYRVEADTSMLDGVERITTYEYDSQDKILSPVKTSFINSDGKLHETEVRYLVDYHLSSGLKNVMINRHMIGIPYDKRVYVDGQLLDGATTVYSNYYSSGTRTTSTSTAYFPRPYYNQRYERTWTNGVLQSGSWVVQDWFFQYNSYGLIFNYKKNGWSNTYYYYNSDKLLNRKKYFSHETLYAYEPNSNLPSQVTGVDGTTTSYTYDKLMRLKTEQDDCSNIQTTYNYFITGNLSSQKNYTEVIEDYPSASNSNVDVIKTRTYKDGLGRPIQTIRNKQAPNSKDIILSKAYDNQGREKYSYRPVQGSYNDARYVTPLSSWHKSETEYYDSPLNRVYRSKSQDWHWTYSYYGANGTGDAVKKDGTSNSYAANDLFKTTSVDGNGNKSVVFTDKAGRTILSRRTDNAETASKHLDTYSIYDDKGRLTYVLPPGVTSTSSTFEDLYYKYEYDAEDHLVKKKIPGADEVYYKYDSKDLLGGYQDGYLRGLNQWYTYYYDGYGRETKQGFYNGVPSSNFNPSDPQIETIYGTNSYDKDKVKTLKTKILGTSTWLTTTNNYNTCGVLASQSSDNHAGGTISSTMTYDGAYNVTNTNTAISAFGISKTVDNTQTYDHVGRPLVNYFQVDNGVNRIIHSLHYNAKDELTIKYQGHTGSSYLQKIDYSYKNNGLLYRINSNGLYGTQQAIETCSDPNPADPGSNYAYKDLFYLELYYDSKVTGTDANLQYNGNIANAVWQVRGREQGIYAYQYDEYDRLTQARYYDRQNGVLTQSNRYTTTYSYDQRGNIKTLTRNGMYDANGCTSQGLIDNLYYYHHSNTNQLRKVIDFAPSASKSEGYEFGATTDHVYDQNGNQVNNRSWETTTTYNHLNLPTSIVLDGTNKRIDMTYDAAGNMLTKTVKTGTYIDEQRDYIAGAEFVKSGSGSSVLESIGHAEGRVFYTNGSNPRYEYVLTDHLGNTRLLYTDLDNDGQIETPEEILWEGHYYPFGMEMKGPWMDQPTQETNYKYNGIEKEEHHGLNINIAAYRVLDPAVGQWCSVDPKAENTISSSPYASMNNNPISNIDPNGDSPLLIGAAIGLITNGISNSIQGESFFRGGFQAAFFGAMSGGISSGIGVAAQTLANGGAGPAAVGAFQAGAHALSGGIMSSAQGGSFWSGAASGGFSSVVGSSISAANGNGFAQWLGGGLSGGVGSSLAGGNFWGGTAQGLITGGLNHAADVIQYEFTKARLIRAAKREGLCIECNDYEVGTLFENLVEAQLNREGFDVSPGRRLQTIFGGTIPDFMVAMERTGGGLHPFGGLVEVKAMKTGKSVTLFRQNGQIFKQLLAAHTAWGPGRGVHLTVTTGGVKVSPVIRTFANSLGIRNSHASAYYTGRMSTRNMKFKRIY